MRVKISTAGKYAYPDVVVTCDETLCEDENLDTLLSPQAAEEPDRQAVTTPYETIQLYRFDWGRCRMRLQNRL